MAELITAERFEYKTREIDARVDALAERMEKQEAERDKRIEDQALTRRMIWTVGLVPLALMLLQVYLSSWSK